MKITHKHEMKPYIHKYFKQVCGGVLITQMNFDVKRKIYSANLHGATEDKVRIRTRLDGTTYEIVERDRTNMGIHEVNEETLKQYFNI
tara:strand:- start:310 stop:573 length:264 start_codon:yes stop_codon:yes gene_type:complete